MADRLVTIDEVLEKVGNFTEQDAVDLIENSHNREGMGKKKTRGHPLQHCEMTTRNWSIPPRFITTDALISRDQAGDFYRNPVEAASE
jgi:hypothetical protein